MNADASTSTTGGVDETPPRRRVLTASIILIVVLGMVFSLKAVGLQRLWDSGAQLATVRFTPATGPLTVDSANPRYFTDGSGRTVYLTGSHTWTNLQDASASDPPDAFDYPRYLDFLESHNHNFFRLWAHEQARWVSWEAGEGYFAPLVYRRTGPDTALDGKPSFDLTQFNDAYFQRLRERVRQAGARGIYVSVMLFDGWSVATKRDRAWNPWRGHPYNSNNNVNGVDGDSDGDGEGLDIHRLDNPTITVLQEAYVRKVVDTLNDLDNVLYEISNESDRHSVEWQYHMIQYVTKYQRDKPKQHPVGMTVTWPGGDNAVLFASAADWISPNASTGDYYENPAAADGSKVIITDTDHLCGICGDAKWVWKSFLRGLNPIFMDGYEDVLKGGFVFNAAQWTSLRQTMGYTLTLANRLDLAAMTPRGELASTGYCLAITAADKAAYLVYLPRGGRVTVDLSDVPGNLLVEWFYPKTGAVVEGHRTTGGRVRSFRARWRSDHAVLYVHSPGVPRLGPGSH